MDNKKYNFLCCNFANDETKEVNLDQIRDINLRKEKEYKLLSLKMKHFLSAAFKGVKCKYINVFRDQIYDAYYYISQNLEEIVITFDTIKLQIKIKNITDLLNNETIKNSKFNKYLQLTSIYLMSEEEKKDLMYIRYDQNNKQFGLFIKLEENEASLFLTCIQILKLNVENKVEEK